MSQHQAICKACLQNLPQLGDACPRCALAISNAYLCGNCLNQPPEQDLSFSLFPYLDPIDRLVADLKYHDKLFLSQFFAQLMTDKLCNRRLPELLIPIPLHPNRLRQRGYNQSFELAKALSIKLAIPTSNRYLIRTIDTKSQASIPFIARKQNIQHVFKFIQTKVPAHIAIIDDVLTTGHTANAAVKQLRKAGAITIEIWTIARAIRHY
ncbi:MAG: ComF family protein [Pseudomonadota bacterium]|nr:ComF family protein [Pseudomonadota bacterium]MDO7711545.1 ComF family protein [Pseudomonadota bacterium]